MKFDCPNCVNRKCHHNLYGYGNQCYMTSWANNPKKCKEYKPAKKEKQSTTE